jgi:hypothetical protein
MPWSRSIAWCRLSRATSAPCCRTIPRGTAMSTATRRPSTSPRSAACSYSKERLFARAATWGSILLMACFTTSAWACRSRSPISASS